ncbi:hypothetical protein BGX27_006052, partial [Mortierella sp. AM989]
YSSAVCPGTPQMIPSVKDFHSTVRSMMLLLSRTARLVVPVASASSPSLTVPLLIMLSRHLTITISKVARSKSIVPQSALTPVVVVAVAVVAMAVAVVAMAVAVAAMAVTDTTTTTTTTTGMAMAVARLVAPMATGAAI